MTKDPFPITKADWLAQVAKDLKGRPLDELRWLLAEGIVADPFVGAEDLPNTDMPPLGPANVWQINEDIPVADLEAAHTQAMEALHFGAESLCFILDQTPDVPTLQAILEGIYLDYISLHFSGAGIQQNPGGALAALLSVAQTKNIAPEALDCSFDYHPVALGGLQDWRYLSELIAFSKEAAPSCQLIQLVALKTELLPVAALTELLRQADQYLSELSKKGVPPIEIARHLHFEVAIGQSYFVEIARLRALHLLWFNLLKAWEIPLFPATIAVRFDPAHYDNALYTNMVRGTTMAMSGILGGASRLTVLPYDTQREAAATYSRTFARRIARNVQHLLKMESKFDQLKDPAAGSYYIETLTIQLAEKAWAQFGKHT